MILPLCGYNYKMIKFTKSLYNEIYFDFKHTSMTSCMIHNFKLKKSTFQVVFE